jgi:hypothetical protein
VDLPARLAGRDVYRLSTGPVRDLSVRTYDPLSNPATHQRIQLGQGKEGDFCFETNWRFRRLFGVLHDVIVCFACFMRAVVKLGVLITDSIGSERATSVARASVAWRRLPG